MTTITPKAQEILLTLEMQSPFHHGAGSAGNTSILRTHDVMQNDGSISKVPFLSAASIRHALRDVLAWHLAQTLAIEPGSLTKAQVDLLWTGGSVSSTGAKTDLDMMRRVEKYLPMLSLLGYAAKSDIITGTLRASDFILDCQENNTRTGLENPKRAAAYRSEVFGTRHDQATSPAGRYIEIAGDGELTTAQMIWDTQVLVPGSRLIGSLSVTPAASHMQIIALEAALHLWAPDGTAYVGAKTAQGFGQATVHGLKNSAEHLDTWEQHIAENKTEILELIKDIA